MEPINVKVTRDVADEIAFARIRFGPHHAVEVWKDGRKVRSSGYGGRIACICDGIACRYCGANPVRRPLTDHIARDDNVTYHTPWFGYLIPCGECQTKSRGPTVTPYEFALAGRPGETGQ